MNNLTLKEIADTVCAATGLDIRTRTRKQQYFFGRMIYAKIARQHTFEILKNIGEEVGIKHDMTLHCLKRFDKDRYTGSNNRVYENVLRELGLTEPKTKEEVEIITNLDLLQLSVLRDLKELSYSELSEFQETRLKPFKKALESRIQPKVIVKVAGAMLNK